MSNWFAPLVAGAGGSPHAVDAATGCDHPHRPALVLRLDDGVAHLLPSPGRTAIWLDYRDAADLLIVVIPAERSKPGQLQHMHAR